MWFSGPVSNFNHRRKSEGKSADEIKKASDTVEKSKRL